MGKIGREILRRGSTPHFGVWGNMVVDLGTVRDGRKWQTMETSLAGV